MTVLHFIGGESTAGVNERRIPVLDPATGQMTGQVVDGGPETVRRAVDSAHRGQQAWWSMSPDEREKIMLDAAAALPEARESLRERIIGESGSVYGKADYEVTYSAALMRTAAGEVRRLYGETFPNDRNHRMSIVVREPVGVVGAIAPFNAPLALPVKMVMFAIACGNGVVLKPSVETPGVAEELARICFAAGFPPGLLNIVQGGNAAGEALVADAGVSALTFTGSTAGGIRVGQAAAARVCPVHLELGGKNPLIVMEDFDPVRAAAIAAVGAWHHAGQICMASSRVLVHEKILPEFLDALQKKAGDMVTGDLRNPATTLGPLINERALHKTDGHVRKALDGGARLICGGRVLTGLVYAPTAVLDPAPDSLLWQEETFGPVMSVRGVSGAAEAVRLANDTPYGLSAGILCHHLPSALEMAREIRAGSVHIGNHSFQSDAMAPVGGVGLSGIGRGGGHYGLEHFTRQKWISLELGETPLPF